VIIVCSRDVESHKNLLDKFIRHLVRYKKYNTWEGSMQFMVIAYDGKDDEALDRRMAAREAHLTGFKERYDKGEFIFGSAILDEGGKMVGSIIVCDFPSRRALDEVWLKSEPYITGDVWREVEIVRAQVPPFLLEK
jgi:uncharacterized protein